MDKVSYSLGLGIARQLAGLGATDVNADDFAQALKDVFAGKEPQVSDAEGQNIVSNYLQKKQEEAAARLKEEGQKFLLDNGKKEGVITTESGLQYQVLREGNGKKPSATDRVECHYEGTLINGKKFDSSYDRGQTATFGLDQVIKGWTEGLQLMQEGAKYRFFIPYELGYGAQGAGQAIPPYATLIFDVELIAVK